MLALSQIPPLKSFPDERRKSKKIVRQKSARFYRILTGVVPLIPFRRYATASRWMVSPRLKSTVINIEGGQWLIFPGVASTWAFPFGLKEVNVSCHLRALLHQADGFIDCGANLGWYSFLASRLAGIKNLVAVEPVSHSLRYLKLIKKLNQIENLTLVRGCVSNHDGTVQFSCPKKRFSEMGYVELHPTIGGLRLPSYTLETIIGMFPSSSNRLCIKIDVEGHEKMALHSISKETLSQRIQSAIVEVHLYKFSNPVEELKKICQALSVIGKPQFLLPPQLSPPLVRFSSHLWKYYPAQEGSQQLIDLVQKGSLPEVHVLVNRG